MIPNLSALVDTPWALDRTVLSRLVAHAQRSESVAPSYRPSPPRRAGAVAVIGIMGAIEHRPSILLDLFGGTSVEDLRSAIRGAAGDPNVSAIVLDVDSPGGGVAGLTELASEIRAARQRKPVVAIANTIAASAAYWIASQADQLLVTPSGRVGSIGVYALHMDISRGLDAMGIVPTIISAGERKVDGNEFEPLSDRARDEMQASVDAFHDMFIDDVARGRRVSPGTVRHMYGEGAVLLAEDALEAGMVDAIGTLDDALRVATRPAVPRRPSALSAAAFPGLDDLEELRPLIHESAHLAANAYFDLAPAISAFVWGAEGMCRFRLDDGRVRPEKRIGVLLAGAAAERLFGFPNAGQGSGLDRSEARRIAGEWGEETWAAGAAATGEFVAEMAAAVPHLAAILHGHGGYLAGAELERAIEGALNVGRRGAWTPEQRRLREGAEDRAWERTARAMAAITEGSAA